MSAMTDSRIKAYNNFAICHSNQVFIAI